MRAPATRATPRMMGLVAPRDRRMIGVPGSRHVARPHSGAVMACFRQRRARCTALSQSSRLRTFRPSWRSAAPPSGPFTLSLTPKSPCSGQPRTSSLRTNTRLLWARAWYATKPLVQHASRFGGRRGVTLARHGRGRAAAGWRPLGRVPARGALHTAGVRAPDPDTVGTVARCQADGLPSEAGTRHQ